MRYIPSSLNLVALCLLTTLLSGCGTNSTITNAYVDPLLSKLDLEGVLVIGVTQQRAARIEFEDSFAAALARHNVRAVPSHTLLAKEGKATAEEIVALAKANQLEMVLVTRYMGATSEEIYHPGTIYYDVTPAYGGGYYGGFPGYYGRAYEVAYEQPVWSTNTTHKVVSDLYVTESQEHMWQAVSDTIKAGSTDKLRRDAIASLVGNLKDQGLLD